MRDGGLKPILVGPRAAIEEAAAAAGVSLDGAELLEAETPVEAAAAPRSGSAATAAPRR